MRWLYALALGLNLFAATSAAAAPSPSASRTVTTVSWVEEWDPVTQTWVRIEETETASLQKSVALPQSVPPTVRAAAAPEMAHSNASARYTRAPAQSAPRAPIAQYGPFLVMDANRAAMVGSTGSRTPDQFDAMLNDFPDLTTLEMTEAPGTSNDIANLAAHPGRRIDHSCPARRIGSVGRGGALLGWKDTSH